MNNEKLIGSSKMNEKLIELVKEHKCLYDVSDRKYCDNQKKEEIWQEIAKKLQVQEKYCKRSWALLRDSFRRAVKKSKELRSEEGSGPTKKWKYAEEMSFLLPYLKERPTFGIIQYESTNEDEDSVTAENPSYERARPASRERPPERCAQSYTPLPKRKQMTPLPALSDTPSTTLMKYILENKAKASNDIQQFFDSISTTVQSFPPRDRAIAKAKVFRVVSEMELEILSRAPYSFVTESQTSYETHISESPNEFYEVGGHQYQDNKPTQASKNQGIKDSTVAKKRNFLHVQ